MAADCPEPEVCRRCRKEGHLKDDCPEPEKCYNCRQEGHNTADCPEPEMCRRCKKEVSQLILWAFLTCNPSSRLALEIITTTYTH